MPQSRLSAVLNFVPMTLASEVWVPGNIYIARPLPAPLPITSRPASKSMRE